MRPVSIIYCCFAGSELWCHSWRRSRHWSHQVQVNQLVLAPVSWWVHGSLPLVSQRHFTYVNCWTASICISNQIQITWVATVTCLCAYQLS